MFVYHFTRARFVEMLDCLRCHRQLMWIKQIVIVVVQSSILPSLLQCRVRIVRQQFQFFIVDDM
jgi:hypothetical protein